ncbi:hypothetical protein GCM10028812_53630 [Ancylobacter sonchi]
MKIPDDILVSVDLVASKMIITRDDAITFILRTWLKKNGYTGKDYPANDFDNQDDDDWLIPIE